MTSKSFVAQINLQLADKLRADLIGQGFTLTRPDHSIFSAKKPGVSCTLYESGKLLIQGKAIDDFILYYIEPEILHNLTYSHPEQYIEMKPHIGVDEAGKGDFFGPLCTAAIYCSTEDIGKLLKQGVRDSKQFSDPAIRRMATVLQKEFKHSIVSLPPSTYNRLYQKFGNLNSLLGWAHATAIENVYNLSGCDLAFIDQFAHVSIVENAVASKKIPVQLVQRHKGESDPVVAAASILARNAFLVGIEKLSQQYHINLPKGASAAVIAAGKQFLQLHNREALGSIAKLHFKTTDQL
ncbi:MAG: ribonuclease HIII [Chlamydiales bacterium]